MDIKTPIGPERKPLNGPAATKAAQTHCIRGHAFDETNTYRKANGTRSCRACRREHETTKKAARGPAPPPARGTDRWWAYRHGHTLGHNPTPEYQAWHNMLQRCYTPTAQRYDLYGARGIIVCDRWRHDFSAFFADIGPRPSRAHSIDRINNNGNYEPNNVRWATRAEQMRNTRRTRLVEHQGEIKTVTDWAAQFGKDPSHLGKMLRRGVPFTEAVAPARQGGFRPKGSRVPRVVK